MSEPTRVMVDIESLGTEPGAAILSVGAVPFDTDGVVTWFYRNGDCEYVARHGKAGRQVVDRDTVERNIDHDHTTVETIDVDDSPFEK